MTFFSNGTRTRNRLLLNFRLSLNEILDTSAPALLLLLLLLPAPATPPPPAAAADDDDDDDDESRTLDRILHREVVRDTTLCSSSARDLRGGRSNVSQPAAAHRSE